MRTVPKWVNKIHEADKTEPSSVRAICWSPDGQQLIVAAGSRVMVYSPSDGSLLQLLQAHKGAVYCLAYSSDGKHFASGGADKTVIIWNSKLEGVLKYTHNESIQCLCYDPVSLRLASCSPSDYAIWSSGAAGVQRTRMSGHITCCAWSPSTSTLALGLASGDISVRNQSGEEKYRIERETAVWAICWTQNGLFVTDWSGKFSLYDNFGKQKADDADIGVWAVSLHEWNGLCIVSGAGGWVAVAPEGVTINKADLDWVWSAVPSPCNDMLAVGCEDGTLWCYRVIHSTVHALHGKLYAYRDKYTNVIVQEIDGLNQNVKWRVCCGAVVRRVSVHGLRLCVQVCSSLNEVHNGDIVIYHRDESKGYRVIKRLDSKADCSLLVATHTQLLSCQDSTLTRIDGAPTMTWKFPSAVRYVKVLTMDIMEVLLLGLADGQIWRVNVESGDSSLLLECDRGVRCVDVDSSRTLLAAVDDSSLMSVYNINTNTILYQESGVNSCAWSSCCPALLCGSGDDVLIVRDQNTVAQRPANGSVVAFHGNQVVCLQGDTVHKIAAPLSRILAHYINTNDLERAYAICCVGVTSREWRRLSHAAARVARLSLAMRAAQRDHTSQHTYLLYLLQEKQSGGESREIIKADWLAGCGQLTEAAKLYKAAKKDNLAMEMYADLGMFDEAQEYGVVSTRRAAWAVRECSPQSAVAALLLARDVKSASELMAQHKLTDTLLETSRKLDKKDELLHIAKALESIEEHNHAGDIYKKIGDIQKAVEEYCACGQYDRAVRVAESAGIECAVKLAYRSRALALAAKGELLQATQAWHQAGDSERAKRCIHRVHSEAIRRQRFTQAARAMALLAQAEESEEYELLSEVYYAYDALHNATYDPFSSQTSDTLINHAKFILAMLNDRKTPPGIDMFCVWSCVCRHGNIQSARSAAAALTTLRMPSHTQESMELLCLRRRAGVPINGLSMSNVDEEWGAICWRCGRRVLQRYCLACGHPTLYSYCSFEALPLVEFKPEEGIKEDEAIALLNHIAWNNNEMLTSRDGVSETFTLGTSDDDVFTRSYNMEETPYVVCSRKDLEALSPSCVIIIRRHSKPTLYYRNMMPNVPITYCPNCFKLFYAEDFESQIAMYNHCPFCQLHPDDKGTSKLFNI